MQQNKEIARELRILIHYKGSVRPLLGNLTINRGKLQLIKDITHPFAQINKYYTKIYSRTGIYNNNALSQGKLINMIQNSQ